MIPKFVDNISKGWSKRQLEAMGTKQYDTVQQLVGGIMHHTPASTKGRAQPINLKDINYNINEDNLARKAVNNQIADSFNGFLEDTSGPSTKKIKDANGNKIEAQRLTQGDIWDKSSTLRGQLGHKIDEIKTQEDILKTDRDNYAAELRSQGISEDKITTAIKGYNDELAIARQDRVGANTARALSFGTQAWDHTKRVGSWALLEGSTMDRVKKTALVGGAYMGANIAMRGMTGGGVTYNNDGRRDIAGVPFL